jgi:DNA-binding SARP family transcriptional activator
VVEFFVLGPLETVVDGDAIRLQAAKPRALLAVLLLSRNRVVSVSELVDALWGDDPPETAVSALQVYVSQLRKALGPDRVLTKPPGYSLRVEEGELDLERFERLFREGRDQLGPDPAAAAERLKEALELWRGPALAEFGSEPFAREAGGRLDDARLAAIELRIDADLALGRHAELVSELEELVEREPFRERLRAQLMLALYRSGRQADALDLYRGTRELFVDELGIEPSPELQELEGSILRHEASLRLSRPGAPTESPPTRRRLGLATAVVAVPILLAGVVAVSLRDGGSSPPESDHELRTFVMRLENFLTQSREGRREVAASVAAAFRCKLSPRDAAERLNRVQRNRQSLLQQIAALTVPDDERAQGSSDLFQKAAHASITADWHYRDWLQGRKQCGPPDQSPDLAAALAADHRATLAKQTFVAAFNPLARRFRQPLWTAGEF